MALRKAGAYSKRKVTPFTRTSKVRQKSYIKTVPHSKIVKFRMGDLKGYDKGKYPIVLNVRSKTNVQMRDNSIESVRQFMNRFLLIQVGKEFFFEVKVYPHHIIRENKMLTGAGSDRMQTGMALSFGKSMGKAALIKKNQIIFAVAVQNQKQEVVARKLISSVKSRIPTAITIEKVDNSKKK